MSLRALYGHTASKNTVGTYYQQSIRTAVKSTVWAYWLQWHRRYDLTKDYKQFTTRSIRLSPFIM